MSSNPGFARLRMIRRTPPMPHEVTDIKGWLPDPPALQGR